MKLLVVKYLPSGENSNTLKLYKHFLNKIGKHEIEELDLLETKLPIFNPETINANNRINMGMGDSKSELLMVPFKALAAKMKAADLIVFVHPMHNFSLPGLVKQFMDSIILNGETFTYGNPTHGLLGDKKAIIIYTSGGNYPKGSDYEYLNNVVTLYKILLDYIGIKERNFVHAATANPTLLDESIQNAQHSIDSIVKHWKL